MATSSNPVNSMSGVELQREQTRTLIAYISLLGYFILLLAVIAIGWAWLRLEINDVLKMLTTIASILGGIVGAVIGFYFKEGKKT